MAGQHYFDGPATDHMVWIAWDLGVNGDYPGLYAWLDKHHAKMCGAATACLNYVYTGHDRIKMAELRASLKSSMVLAPHDRIYVIYLDHVQEALGQTRGSWWHGNRRDAPWTGAAGLPTPDDC